MSKVPNFTGLTVVSKNFLRETDARYQARGIDAKAAFEVDNLFLTDVTFEDSYSNPKLNYEVGFGCGHAVLGCLTSERVQVSTMFDIINNGVEIKFYNHGFFLATDFTDKEGFSDRECPSKTAQKLKTAKKVLFGSNKVLAVL